MKRIPFIKAIILFVIVSQSCTKVLDRKPLDTISEDIVWDDPSLVAGYVTDLYSKFPFFAFEFDNWDNWTDESSDAIGNNNDVTHGTVSKTLESNPYFDYTYIRSCNVFFQRMETSLIDESTKNQLEGEVHFIRAFSYFEMIKRYGGVPLVDTVLDPYGTIDVKYTKRASEEAIADFIDAETTLAASLLSQTPTPKGRASKGAAMALKARAMLWAASIAKYGSVQLSGLVGIPEEKAAGYYAKASAAADSVINSGNYALFNELPDNKSENYRKLFLVEENSEVIFEKAYDGTNIGHRWDSENGPNQWSIRGGTSDPTLEFILGYENIDGSTDQPEFGTDKLYSNGAEPFVKKDPRLFATVFFQGDPWANGTVQTYEGLDPSPIPTPSEVLRNPNLSYMNVPTVGADSRSLTKDDFSTSTGFHIKKYIDDSGVKIPEGLSKTNWIVFRLAEMYLTKAEAEFELGNKSTAADALNMTRSRAGISLVDETSITLEKVRTERRSELAFEEQRWWDLRRWHIAESVLNHRFQGLQIIFHYDSGKFYFIPFDAESFSRVFRPAHYYNPITTARIDNNPQLVENPLY